MDSNVQTIYTLTFIPNYFCFLASKMETLVPLVIHLKITCSWFSCKSAASFQLAFCASG